MKRYLGVSLVAAALAWADSAPADAARQLYEAGMRQTEEGKLDAARASLESLVKEYPKDPLVPRANGAIDATLLFEDGQARVKAGKYETARVTLNTLIAVYPESPLAGRARSAIVAIAGKEKVRRPVVKAVEFRDVQPVPVEEIRAAMDAREVRLSVGQPCRSKDIEQAKTVLEEILAEKGVANVRVATQTRAIPPHSVDVIFTVEKPRTSMLRAPWRLGVAAWHRVRPGTSPAHESL
jgi:Surface antigen variable number repeat/Tetratricopeptide repeat